MGPRASRLNVPQQVARAELKLGVYNSSAKVDSTPHSAGTLLNQGSTTWYTVLGGSHKENIFNGCTNVRVLFSEIPPWWSMEKKRDDSKLRFEARSRSHVVSHTRMPQKNRIQKNRILWFISSGETSVGPKS